LNAIQALSQLSYSPDEVKNTKYKILNSKQLFLIYNRTDDFVKRKIEA
jgi:hypothetical protein